MLQVKCSEKIYVFKCEESRKIVSVQAVNLLTACKKLYADLNSFSFILIAIV